MATPRFAWGIDIGNRALKAVKLVQGADGLVIDDFDVVEHETVLSASGDNRDTLIQSALSQFVARHPGIDKGQVGITVNSRQTFNKFIKLPPVETKRIPEIVRFEAIQQIPFPLDDVEWAYQLFQDPASPEVEVGIFAMRKELVTQQIKFYTDAKLNVQVVQMSPLAVYNAMYYDSRIKETTMFVDLGAENTDLVIAEGETVWLRSIPIGGDSFTEALTKSFKVNFGKAEDLKRNASTNKYGRQIMQAMRPIFADLVSEIQRSMGFYSSVHKESRITRVVAMGNTFRLPGLQRYLQQNLTLGVDRLNSLGNVAIEDGKVAALFGENVLSAAGAYGLALQVMNQGKIASSLLPERIRNEKVWREKTKWFAAAAAVFVAGTAVAYGMHYLNAGQMNDQANVDYDRQISAVASQAKTLDAEWTEKVQEAGVADRQRLANALSLTAGRQVWPEINDLIYQTLPQNGGGGGMPTTAPSTQPAVTSAAAAGSPTTQPADMTGMPRGQRNQILIVEMTSRYAPDLTPYKATPSLGGDPQSVDVQVAPTGLGQLAGGGAPPAAPSDPGLNSNQNGTGGGAPTPAAERGYIVTIRCTTPNADGAQKIDQYMAALRAAEPTDARPIKVVNATVVRSSRIKDDAARMSAMKAAYLAKKQLQNTQLQQAMQGGGGGGGGGPVAGGGYAPGEKGGGRSPLGGPTDMGGAGAETVPDEAYQDPATKEDVRNDTESVIVLLVSVDPQKAPPKPAVAGGAVAAAQ